MQRDQVFELAWILPSISIPVGMLVALVVSAYGMGIHVQEHSYTIDPKVAAQTAPFDNPGVRQVAPGKYEVAMLSQIWFFKPNELSKELIQRLMGDVKIAVIQLVKLDCKSSLALRSA